MVMTQLQGQEVSQVIIRLAGSDVSLQLLVNTQGGAGTRLQDK